MHTTEILRQEAIHHKECAPSPETRRACGASSPPLAGAPATLRAGPVGPAPSLQ